MQTQLKVGLEIHVELSTQTKMWTAAANVAHPDFFAAEPNTLTSPINIGMPGTLPVANKVAVEESIKVGLALGCEIAKKCKWDRKSYNYPDLPKNYQISQFDEPLVGEGEVTFPVTNADGSSAGDKTVRITRAHLEEDAGKLMHESPGGGFCDGSLVDLNRAGTPLLEIVTEPDFETADEVVSFCKWLHETCRFLGVTEGVMQKGHMRFEPNINLVITQDDGETIATPVAEIKNLNSFKAVHGSILYEQKRQLEQWQEDGKTMGARAKSTRGWDDVNFVTTLQREKEDADEYRYFPDPDLVTVEVDDAWLEAIRATLPELPGIKKDRYLNEYKLNPKIVEQLLAEPSVASFYDAVITAGADAGKASAFLLNTAAKLANEQQTRIDLLGATAEQVADIVKLVASNQVGSNNAGDLLVLCNTSDDPAQALAEANSLVKVQDDSALEGWVEQVIANPGMAKAVQDIKDGKDKAVGALMGQVMKLSKGQADAGSVREMIFKKLRD